MKDKKTKNEYSKDEIAEMNVLDVLETVEDFSKRGINFNEIFSIFKFEKEIKIYEIPTNLGKKGLVERNVMEIRITKKGKKELGKFRSNADKKNRRKFSLQRPLEYQLLSRINTLEMFIGFFFLTLLLSGLFSLFSYLIDLVKFKGSEVIFSAAILITFILTFFSFFIFLAAMWTLIVRGVGLLIKPISFNFSFYLEENSEKVGKWITWGIIIIGTLVAWKVVGIEGLLGGIALAFLIKLITEPRWLSKYIDKKTLK